MSDFVKLGGKTVKLNILGSIQHVITAFLDFFYQKWFFLVF